MSLHAATCGYTRYHARSNPNPSCHTSAGEGVVGGSWAGNTNGELASRFDYERARSVTVFIGCNCHPRTTLLIR